MLSTKFAQEFALYQIDFVAMTAFAFWHRVASVVQK